MMINRKRGLPWFNLVGLLFLGMNLSACVEIRSSLAKVTPMSSTSMVIYESMTRNHSGSFGVLNIYIDTRGFPNALTPTTGQEKKELTATLWLMIVERPDTYTSFSVQSGQIISFEGYKIKVFRIEKDKQDYFFVEVEVTEAE
jgi:hypothetical protein